MQVVFQSDKGNEWIYRKVLIIRIHSFSFYGQCILEREHWTQNKIIGIKHFKLLSKDSFMADLRKIGLNMRGWCFLAPPRVGPCPSLCYPHLPKEKWTAVHIFCLTVRKWSLTCWATKFRENTGSWCCEGCLINDWLHSMYVSSTSLLYPVLRDHYTFLGNRPPTPPLSQHFEKKVSVLT